VVSKIAVNLILHKAQYLKNSIRRLLNNPIIWGKEHESQFYPSMGTIDIHKILIINLKNFFLGKKERFYTW